MRVNPFIYGLLVVVLFFGVIGGAKAAGIWSVSGKLTASGEKVAPTGANVDEIKGWMTLNDVSTRILCRSPRSLRRLICRPTRRAARSSKRWKVMRSQ
jgi:hypothetical protein